jgi:hypothetical protein
MLLSDASISIYIFKRKINILSLFSKLFDVYQLINVRRMLAIHPYERLKGCAHCRQTCETEEAVKWDICTASWWCCQGCREASEHGRNCPHGGPMDSAVLFVP